MIKNLNKMLFQFICQNKPEQIKRELLLQDYKNARYTECNNIFKIIMDKKTLFK